MKENKSSCQKICRTSLLDYALLIEANRASSLPNKHTFEICLRNLVCSPSSVIEIQNDTSSREKINQLWLGTTCYGCVRIRDKIKDVVYSLLAQFDRPTWASLMLRHLSKSNYRFCRLFLARIFANDWKKYLVFVFDTPCFADQLTSCNLEAESKNPTYGTDMISTNFNLLLHAIDIHQHVKTTLDSENGASNTKCHNTSMKIDNAVNPLKRKRGKEEKKVSLEDIHLYLSRSFTLTEAAESLGVSRSTLKRKCRQIGISHWPPSKGRKRSRRSPKGKKIHGFASGLETANLKSFSTSQDVASPCRSSDTNGKKVLSGFEASSLKSVSLVKGVVSQCRSSCGTPKRIKVSKMASGVEATSPKLIHSPIDFISQYWSSCGSPKGNKAAESGSSTRDFISQYRPMDQNLAEDRSLVLLPYSCREKNRSSSYTHALSKTEDVQLDTNLSRYTMTGLAESNEGMTSLIKAKYKDDMVRFHFYFKANIAELKKEVARRLNLTLGTFKVKYLDDEDEWALLASDLDWQEFIYNARSSRSSTVRLLIQDVRTEDGDKDDLHATLLKL